MLVETEVMSDKSVFFNVISVNSMQNIWNVS